MGIRAGLFLLLPFLAAACLNSEADVRDTGIHGVVSDEIGEPVPGAFVTALSTAAGKAVTVVTDVEGRYRFPSLPDGADRVRATRIGFEGSASRKVGANRGDVDFVLRRRDHLFDQALSSQLLSLLPEGEEKRRFVLDCTNCHQFDQSILTFGGRLESRDQWRDHIVRMIGFAGGDSSFPVMSPSRDAERTADWLVAHLGDETDPLPVVPSPAPMTGEAAEVVITEYDLPDGQDLPHDLLPMGDGRVLVTGMLTNRMYVLDPETGRFTTTPIPVENANPRALTLARDGTWWVLLGAAHKIASYDPATDTWQDYDIGMYPHSIVLADDGRLWFNGHFTKAPELIGVLDPATGAVETYEVPTPPMPDGGTTIPYGLRSGPDGTLWGTQLVGGRLMKFVPETETFTLYPLPTPYSGPRRLDIGPEGTVWIPEYANNRLARFDPATVKVTEYELPIPDALPYVVRVDRHTGAVWIATSAADAVLRFDPQSERFVVYRLPTHRAFIRHMELDPETGAAWVAYGNFPAVAPKIARIEPLRQSE